MSEAIILGAIQKMESFLVETPSINTNFEQILKEVINELRMMLDFLRDKESGERSRLNYLLADLAEIAQDSADVARNTDDCLFSHKIFDARDWLRKTKKNMMEFGVGEGVNRPQSVGEEGDEGVVVGLEKDVQQLIGRAILNEEVQQLATLCIKGMLGGVGKTTLARRVYNHPAIIEKFKHRRAWVSISSDTSIHEVLVELIQQLVKLDGDSLLVEEMDNRSLRQMLRRHLKGMPYIIVVDNLLPEMRLESIFGLLPDEGHGSRLLFTSSSRITTTYIYYTHEMKALDADESWQLFLKTIFRGDKFTSDEKKLSKDLERKGREMLKKCGGLPFAIIDVGRQKAKQRLSGIEWEQLFDSIDLSESLKLLEPMYHKLDEELKPCFLHMSFFKENAIIREEKLEQIWAASGLNTRSYSTYHLFSQSVVEVMHPYPAMYEVKRCRINPLLHMLSIKKAEEEIGFEILRSNGNNRPSQNPRHRVIHCGRDKFNHSTDQHKHLVSLIFHGGGCYLDDASQSYWKSFELLKIIDMEDFGAKTLSETIGALIELRYLGLRNNYIQEIPHSFGNLKKLEVLDIALNFMVEMPDIIKEMGSLCHLYMSDVIYQKPLKVDALQNLKTLIYISIYDWTYEISGLETMTLWKLGIEEVDENSNVGELFESLAKLERLNHLIFRGFRFRSMPCLDEIGVLKELRTLRLDGLLSKLPSADNFPLLINNLALVNTCLDEDPMPVLENLPHLERLKLRNAYTGQEMVIQHGRFPELEVLCISESWNLRDVQVSKYAMWKLNQLEIKNCPHLETLPQEIGSMEFLKKFKMVTTKHIATKIRNSGLISKIVEVDIIP